jgi:hypothetical protein
MLVKELRGDVRMSSHITEPKVTFARASQDPRVNRSGSSVRS